MKSAKSCALVLTVVAGGLSLSASAQSPAKTDFAYWREMPEVTQVIKDVQGKDDQETAARRLAAYRLLSTLWNANTNRIGETPWRPRAIELYNAYPKMLLRQVDARTEEQADRILIDRAFTRPFLKRYFSEVALADIQPIVLWVEATAKSHIDQRAKEAAPSFPDANQTAQAPTQPWRDPPGKPSDRVAADFVRAKIGSYWIKNADGWTTKLRPTTNGGYVDRSAPEYKQYRNIEFRIEQEALSEAQRLNGIEYRGHAVFQKTPERFFRNVRDYNAPKGWSDWQDAYIFPIAVERRNGEWLIERAELFQSLNPGTTTVPERQ